MLTYTGHVRRRESFRIMLLVVSVLSEVSVLFF